jgi:murein DD-endopeptidase MepM/ murein hydrolase activator NlpD
MDNIQFDVIIDQHDNYTISNMLIPPPKLTHLKLENKKVHVYGIGIPKYHKMRINISKTYMNYYEAKESCNKGLIIWPEEIACMEKKMGIEDFFKWKEDRREECNTVFGNCLERRNTWRKRRIWKNKGFNVDHVAVDFFENNSNRHLGIVWNDNSIGRFKKSFNLDIDVRSGEKIKARTVLFGDIEIYGISIDYRGQDNWEASQNSGLKSLFSNELEISTSFIKGIVHPMSDPSCEGYMWTSGFGIRRDPYTYKSKFHSGVDLAKRDGCKIKNVYTGSAKSQTWWAGNGVWIKHDNIYETKYGHGKYFIGSYPRTTLTGEEIMYMGKTGKSTGVHLHFEVWENGQFVDPSKYFAFDNKTF